MSTSLPPSFPLPAIHKALSPYIRSTSEVHEIRQLITSHVQSLATLPRISSAQGSSDELNRFLDLELSRTDGIRRQYLTALRDNTQARAEYQTVLGSFDTPDDDDDEEEDRREVDESWKQAYIAVLQLRRQLARLNVLREGVTAFSEVTLDRPPGGLGGAYPHAGPVPPQEILPKAAANGGGAAEDPVAKEIANTDGLILALEKRIVTTHEQLLTEQARLKELELQEIPEGAGNKRLALHQTHTELVEWLTSALSVAPTAADDDEDAPPSPTKKQPGSDRESQTTPESVLAAIDNSYKSYLTSRTSLLSLLTSPLPPTVALPAEDPQTASETATLLSHRLDPTPPAPTPPVLRILAGAEHLLPLSRAQKALLQTQNSLATSIARRRVDLASVFDSNPNNHDPVDGAQDVAAKVDRVWTEAQKKASKDTDSAREMLFKAGETMGEVEELCGGRGKKRSIPVRGSTGSMRGEEKKAGLWGSLDGGVGVIGDGI